MEDLGTESAPSPANLKKRPQDAFSLLRPLRSISSAIRKCLGSVCQRPCGEQHERPQSLQSGRWRRQGERLHYALGLRVVIRAAWKADHSILVLCSLLVSARRTHIDRTHRPWLMLFSWWRAGTRSRTKLTSAAGVLLLERGCPGRVLKGRPIRTALLLHEVTMACRLIGYQEGTSRSRPWP